MSELQLQFVTLDVFTTTRFKGNPLAIVYVPNDIYLTQEQKQTITREFNLSETVFLHPTLPGSAHHRDGAGTIGDVPIDIFTIAHELPFAGHPTVGVSYHLLRQVVGEAVPGEHAKPTRGTLITKAGRIPVSFDPETNRAKLEVPHAITIHSEIEVPTEKVAEALGIASFPPDSIIPNDASGTAVALVSIVRGLAFLLVHVSSLEVLEAMRITGIKFTAESLGLMGHPDLFIGTYAYYFEEEHKTFAKIRTRMFEGSFEDSATGSAASCLCGFLSIRAAGKGNVNTVRAYELTQGVEMGRQSDIVVGVRTKPGPPHELHQVEKILLSGAAVTVMKGTISVQLDA